MVTVSGMIYIVISFKITLHTTVKWVNTPICASHMPLLSFTPPWQREALNQVVIQHQSNMGHYPHLSFSLIVTPPRLSGINMEEGKGLKMRANGSPPPSRVDPTYIVAHLGSCPI